ncbi:Endonuclease/Exonuclease/phosphatase family protein [Loktanella sp. DSM 29012]|uniref:endonuclease/exonuclease/phosphatase family protein n=1 Tax=Loktanella sp. DSM 29012 TaxID=1881056 RepID=UPI0008B2C572|nr:endonuclease/exonuclease/phosphatase family protein [Loktanella sp. DSM 29012]SEQ04496.1 Endonuclease/Exonuclease/phosphatase family protein [Loktanella sp. DSM 29012]
MRLATWNVAWFDALFDDAGALVRDDGWSKRWDVTRRDQADAIAHVLQTMNADAIMVIEAPDTSSRRSGAAALRNFADHYGLRQRAALIGFANDTRQEIALMFDPDCGRAVHRPLSDNAAPRFDRSLTVTLNGHDIDAVWSKPPLELVYTPRDGAALSLIGVHSKSKAAHGDTAAQRARVGVANRRKQLSQCLWLRRRVDQMLRDDPAARLVVLGDFNDGPGLDEYEVEFGQSGVEIVLGTQGDRMPLHDPHAQLALGSRNGARPATARFRPNDGPYLSALLDYIMVSPALRATQPVWRIWHPFDDPEVFADTSLREALLLASDHFPVTLDLMV